MTEAKKAHKQKLFGLDNSNRQGVNLWGKNQFNSTFPASLACWMKAKKIKPVYVSVHKVENVAVADAQNIKIAADDTCLTFDDVFNAVGVGTDLQFDFEIPYAPYDRYTHDVLDHIDLVVRKSGVDGLDGYLRALEVKLTVLPDNATCKRSPDQWGCELVIRPDTTSYAALTIFDALQGERDEAKKILKEVGAQIPSNGWTNITEISTKAGVIVDTLSRIIGRFYSHQLPFLVQPVWRTEGKVPQLSENAFDVFVWSNMALCMLFIEQAKMELVEVRVGNKVTLQSRDGKVSRYLRACARLLRCLYELFSSGTVNITDIFSGMTLGNQTDKEFALNGVVTHKYMCHERLSRPVVPQSALREIILGGGEKLLSPERRFDATIFFTAMHLFEEK